VKLKLLFALIYISSTSQFCLAANFNHIKTFGFDYIDLSDDSKQAQWLAKHHDWIIGPQNGGLTVNSNLIKNAAYSEIMHANKNAKIAAYAPYSTVFPYMSEWMEEWCREKGHNPEDLYLHYEEDVSVNSTKGKMKIPGYGKGSATELSQSRVTARWWGGQYPNINPASEVFRQAFNEYVLMLVTVKNAKNVYVHGLFLDSYNATTETSYWSRELGKTIEFRKMGISSESKAIGYMEKMLVKHSVEMEKFLKKATNQKDFVVIVNAGLAEYMYKDYPDLFVGQRDGLMNVSIEELVSSTIDDRRVPYLKDIYDDLEHGRVFWIRSQTNYNSQQKTIPPAFIQGILAVHYLINHKNAYFFYHEGSPVFYGGDASGNLRKSHWHVNQQYDIGQPVKHEGKDYWGMKNTDRFFIVDSDVNSVVLARKYEKGMVLVKIPKAGRGGWDNIGKNKKKYVLEKEFKQLNEDNTLSEKINAIELGNAEGVILIN